MEQIIIEVGPYEVNCTILAADGKALVVDPGSEGERIAATLAEHKLEPRAFLLTHAHFDHIGGMAYLQRAFPGLALYVHPNDVPVITHPLNQLPPDYPAAPEPTNVCEAKEGELTALKDIARIEVIETPGHTPGGVSYYLPDEHLLLSGDTLFAGSVGRTDFPGGDMATLRQSLKRLAALPAETEVIPGHGPSTTIGDECEGNPFLQF